ncbi:tRNA-dependent cyclodipeptide synthase [Nocardia altamirensis]|uniref:tRNA-dependent cyclodipeptide synthase n=1 Tax=Nocardia altamirensis TaxID=472158 RepID=UPI00083FDB04|nr:tRNA-dependent cyclodipeptide synthase [Nocardia altamirensis]
MLFTAEPYTDNCRRILERGTHCAVVMSPFNSYYKPRLIRSLTRWALTTFGSSDFVVPGIEAADTLVARGWTRERALRRAAIAVGKLRAPTRSALLEAGVADPDDRLHSWTQLAGHPPYQRLRALVTHQYDVDPCMRRAIRQLSARAIGADATDPRIDTCVEYALAEIPFMLDCPSIFGVESSTLVYHRDFEFIRLLLADSTPTPVKPADGQGFIVCRLVS